MYVYKKNNELFGRFLAYSKQYANYCNIFWQPITSIVTVDFSIDKTSSNSGMAVISFDFSSVLVFRL